jgi:hypothetical protein
VNPFLRGVELRLERLRHAVAEFAEVLGDTCKFLLLARAGGALAALEHPLQHAQVFAEARPQEFAGGILAEPVDVENARRRVSRWPTLSQCAK